MSSFDADDISEDRMISLRKRAELDSKYLITFIQNDASELQQSLNRCVNFSMYPLLVCCFLFEHYFH